MRWLETLCNKLVINCELNTCVQEEILVKDTVNMKDSIWQQEGNTRNKKRQGKMPRTFWNKMKWIQDIYLDDMKRKLIVLTTRDHNFFKWLLLPSNLLQFELSSSYCTLVSSPILREGFKKSKQILLETYSRGDDLFCKIIRDTWEDESIRSLETLNNR